MPGVNEAIAREYFESLGFLVLQPHKHLVTARAKRPSEEIDFIVLNPSASHATPPDFLLTGASLREVGRAVVSVRGWHTDRVSPAILKLSPELVRFAQEPAMRSVRRQLGNEPIFRILCLSELPSTASLREKAKESLQEHGVDGVLLFPTMLRELIRGIERNRNYEKSDLLQTLRILKNYDLLRDEQLELFGKSPRKRRGAGGGS
ncbi:MAG: hypothetical protein H3C50_10820 [Kiritimatiellae bacterium]|nr:hypothetical protein [Kiritimatiellia bacterium]MCO5067585.1 hypothetical protein [Kiritimatiellia bacterium]